MPHLAELVAQAAHGSFLVEDPTGRASVRYHYRSVRPADFYDALVNEIIVLGREEPPAKKLKKGAKGTDVVDETERERLMRIGPGAVRKQTEIEEAVVSAGFVGLSSAKEACQHAGAEEHQCTPACFSTFQPVRISRKKEDSNAAQGVLWIGDLSSDTAHRLYQATGLISTEIGRLAERLATFRGRTAPAPAPRAQRDLPPGRKPVPAPRKGPRKP